MAEGGGLQRFPQKDTHTHAHTNSICVGVSMHVRRCSCVCLFELRASFAQAIVGRTKAVAAAAATTTTATTSLPFLCIVGVGWSVVVMVVGGTKPKELLKS